MTDRSSRRAGADASRRTTGAAPAPAKIGLFGGSFDPVHHAHLALARAAVGQLALDELRWVPAGQPWQKTRTLTPAADREAMLRLAIAGEPRWRVERCEIDRAGPSYTLDTVRELQSATPAAQWFLVIGQDQYAGLHTWHGIGELLPRVTLAVARRPGSVLDAAPAVRAAGCITLELPMMPISATEIRTRAAAGQDITAMVPQAVALYIHQHRLYRGDTGS